MSRNKHWTETVTPLRAEFYLAAGNLKPEDRLRLEKRAAVSHETPDTCPLCDGAAAFDTIPYRGTGASGMESPDLRLGCPRCRLWLGQVKTETYNPTGPNRGMVDCWASAEIALLALWNNREGSTVVASPTVQVHTRGIIAVHGHGLLIEEIEKLITPDQAAESPVRVGYRR